MKQTTRKSKPWIQPYSRKGFPNTTEGKDQFSKAFAIARRHFDGVHTEFTGYESILYTGARKHEHSN